MNHLPYFHIKKSWNLPYVCGEKFEKKSYRQIHFNIYSEHLRKSKMSWQQLWEYMYS